MGILYGYLLCKSIHVSCTFPSSHSQFLVVIRAYIYIYIHIWPHFFKVFNGCFESVVAFFPNNYANFFSEEVVRGDVWVGTNG